MAHRAEYSKDINLPDRFQQLRHNLQKQIHKLRERQQFLIQQNDQKLQVLEKRLIYGKKKIFSFDKQINRMTLTDQISHYNMQIQNLKNQIAQQQKALKPKNEHRPQKYPLNQAVIQITGSLPQPFQPWSKIQKNHLILDPQQQLMNLTHEIMRLKKSLQQVRSKYSDNFTEYKLRQQYEKLRQQNEQIAQELKQLQTNQNLINNFMNNPGLSDVNYDQMQMMRVQREFEFVRRERNLLREYLLKLQEEVGERRETDNKKMQEFNEEIMGKYKKEIGQVLKNNEILENQIELTNRQIERLLKSHQLLKGKISG